MEAMSGSIKGFAPARARRGRGAHSGTSTFWAQRITSVLAIRSLSPSSSSCWR